MAKLSTDIHVREVTHNIVLRVRGLKGWGIRIWIAGQLFKLGARVAGVGIIMETDQSLQGGP